MVRIAAHPAMDIVAEIGQRLTGQTDGERMRGACYSFSLPGESGSADVAKRYTRLFAWRTPERVIPLSSVGRSCPRGSTITRTVGRASTPSIPDTTTRKKPGVVRARFTSAAVSDT